MAEFEGGVGPPCVRGIEVDEVGEEMDCLQGGAREGAGAGGEGGPGEDGLLPHPVIISHCTHAFFNKLHTQPMRNFLKGPNKLLACFEQIE